MPPLTSQQQRDPKRVQFYRGSLGLCAQPKPITMQQLGGGVHKTFRYDLWVRGARTRRFRPRPASLGGPRRVR
jgi:hypothetical protein